MAENLVVDNLRLIKNAAKSKVRNKKVLDFLTRISPKIGKLALKATQSKAARFGAKGSLYTTAALTAFEGYRAMKAKQEASKNKKAVMKKIKEKAYQPQVGTVPLRKTAERIASSKYLKALGHKTNSVGKPRWKKKDK